MDYTKMMATLAVAGMTAVAGADIVSSSVVGYQNKSLNSGFNYVANTFVPVGMERSEMTLGDIKPNEDFVNSSIQFLTTGGATATVNDPNLGTVKATYIYWTEDDEPEDGAGWYFFADDDAAYNQNGRVVPFGDAYCVSRASNETDAELMYAGEVQTTAVTKSLVSGFNYVGNCCPKDITLGDITPKEDFVNSSIQFLTPGGATATVADADLGTVKATYIYWTEDDEPEDGAGWYFFADDDAAYNQNGRPLSAGEAFCVSRASNETDATVTIPSAL